MRENNFSEIMSSAKLMNFIQPPTFDYFLIITFSAVCDVYNSLLHVIYQTHLKQKTAFSCKLNFK